MSVVTYVFRNMSVSDPHVFWSYAFSMYKYTLLYVVYNMSVMSYCCVV